MNLRGYDPYEPVAPGGALAGFLRALGVPGQQIPDDVEDRARLYRSRLAGRRVLVLLDNARDGEQVRPLLPGDPRCVAVITSRDALAGLVVADGARRLDLDVLPPPMRVALLRSLIGPRVDEDPAATAGAGRACAPGCRWRCGSPPSWPPPARQVRCRSWWPSWRRPGWSLDAGEDRADVRAVFSWSVRQLPDDVAGAFALIGLHPGEDLDRTPPPR